MLGGVVLAENRKIKLTKKALKEALVELLQERELSTVTVTELCKAADVNRSTFYSHYETLTNVLDDIEHDFLSHIPFYNNVELSRIMLKQHCIQCIQYIEKHQKELTVLLANHRLITRLYQSATKQIPKRLNPEEQLKQELIILSFTSGFFPAVMHWLENPRGLSAEEFADYMLEFLNHTSNFYTETY